MAGIDISQMDELVALRGSTVTDSDGENIGKIEQIWVDNVNGLPEWATVKTGRIRGKDRYVPLRPMEVRDNDIVVGYTKKQVEDAPQFDPETATAEDERNLYRHYGRPLATPSPPEVRNPFAGVERVWAPTSGEGFSGGGGPSGTS